MKRYTILLFLVVGLISCTKLISVDTPQNQLTTDKVFADSVSAAAAVINIYDNLQNQWYSNGPKYLSVYTDESLGSAVSLSPWNQSRVPASEISSTSLWNSAYSEIYQCNSVLEQGAVYSKLCGEAKFLRAYLYLKLINAFGHVPLVITTNVNINRSITQSDSAAVYLQVTKDLNDALLLLPAIYTGSGKVRANKACAKALLAEVNLYQSNWATAESLATELISSGTYSPLDPLSSVFLATGKESILQLATPTGFTAEAGGILPSSTTVLPSYFLTDGFYNSFETGDLRKASWIGTNSVTVSGVTTVYHYPNKYKNRIANTGSPENIVLLRLTEQYLIRAESRIRQGRFAGGNSGEEDINVVRARAGLPALHFSDAGSALTALQNERRHEYFFEGGDRFFDLKRTGRLQSVMSANKSTWLSTGNLLPIPIAELNANPNLMQNAGY